MKKQIKKLSLNKKTISNLGISEMNKVVGGAPHTLFCEPTDNCTLKKCDTQHGHTCNGNNC
jgi:hypothetical protein